MISVRIQKTFSILLLISSFLLLVAVLPPRVLADRITMNDGTVHEGNVVGEDAQLIYLETVKEVVPLAKDRIASRSASQVVIPSRVPARPTPSVTTLRMVSEIPEPPAGNSSEGPRKKVTTLTVTTEMPPGMAAARDRMMALRRQVIPWVKKVRTFPGLAGFFNFLSEVQAENDLKQLAVFTEVYASQKGEYPQSFQDLIACGIEDPNQPRLENLNEYRYRLVPGQKRVEILAEPIDPRLGLKTFRIDSRTQLLSVIQSR